MSRSTLPRLHPLTGARLRPVGYRKSGAPIWPILGGSEPAGEPAPAPDDPAGSPAGVPADGPAPTEPSGAPPASPEPGTWDGKVESLPDGAQKLIRDLRKADGDERIAAKTLAAIQKALNPDAADDKPDPAKLTEQLTATQAEARAVRVENAVLRSAGKHGADPDALTDSRSFLAKLDSLDPAADDFAAQVDAAIADAVTANPKLKTGRAPGASGADHTGGSGEQGATFSKPTSMHNAVAQHYGT